MNIETNGFAFFFPNAVEVFQFDEGDKSKVSFHGLSHTMKAVDIIVELDDHYLFIEIKDFFAPDDYNISKNVNKTENTRKYLLHLLKILKYKYRDTWLYRWAEAKVDKPVHYICLLTLDNAQISYVSKELYRQLPVGQPTRRWQRAIVEKCFVVNFEKWQKNFSDWPIRRV